MWQGTEADMWDPAYELSLAASARFNNDHSLYDPWAPFLVLDEADDLFAFDKTTHTHMGFVLGW